MEHPFLPSATTRAEALRWLTIAEKLLSARDLMGSKSFAARARDSDPTLSSADQILAVADTLLAGDRRICNNRQDWYGILQLNERQGDNTELIASQYRNLAVALNPQHNKFPFADQAFRLVVEAWSVLSSPLRKSMYDKELAFFTQQQNQLQSHTFGNPSSSVPTNFNLFAQPNQMSVSQPQNFMSFTSGSNIVFGSGSSSNPSQVHVSKPANESFSGFGGGNVASPYKANQEQVKSKRQKQQKDDNTNASGSRASRDANVSENVGEEEEDLAGMDVQEEEEERVDEPGNDGGGSTFWTACPYCYYMYEYASIYSDCTMRCQNCRRAFQAVVIPSPPPVAGGGQEYFCCWGYMPLGFSMENWQKQKGAGSAWTPFSPMFTCPQMGNVNDVNKKRGGRKSSGPRVYVDDDEVYVEISDSGDSDDDWEADNGKKKKTTNNVKGKGSGGTPSKRAKNSQVDKGKSVNAQDGLVSADGVETPGESSKKGATGNARKQPGRAAKNYGKLDLNVECSNEAEEPAPRGNAVNGPSRGEDENIEGNGFFEGLDEFLSNLPILNVVSDDKAVGVV